MYTKISEGGKYYMAASLTPILSLLLALSMLVSPAFTTGGQSDGELPAFTFSFDQPMTPETDLTLGSAQTADGAPVLYFSQAGDALYITGDSLTLAAGDAVYSLPVADLAAYAAAAANQLPQPSEQDIVAVSVLAQGLISSISPDAFSFAPRGEGFALAVDVDRLLADVDAAMPQILSTYAAYIDPTLSKYSAPLLGTSITCEQLAQVWPQLGLSQLRTGLTLSLTVIPTADGLTLMGSIAQLSFVCRVGQNGLELRFTTPDGTVYPFDTADFATLAGIFADLPSIILQHYVTYENISDELGYLVKAGYTIQIDTTMLANDLNDAIGQTIAANAATLDPLLAKYQPWLALISPELAKADAAALSTLFTAERIIELPEITGYYSQYNTRVAYVIDSEITGDFGTMTLKGSQLTSRLSSYSMTASAPYTLTLTINDGYEPFIATVNIFSTYRRSHVSVDFSEPVLGLFSTLTYTMDNPGEYIVINTDTDILRYAVSAEEQYMDVKVGPVSFNMRETEAEDWLFHLAMPEFFADVHTNDNTFTLDSTFIGLSVSENDDALVLSGYLTPDEYTRYDFGLDAHPDASYTGGLYHGFFSGEYNDITFTLADNNLHVSFDGDLYSFLPDYSSNAYIVYCNREAIATLRGESADQVHTLWIYQGLDTTAEPVCTFVFDLDPAPVALPGDATPVDVPTFLQTLSELLD